LSHPSSPLQVDPLKEGCVKIAVLKGMTSTLNSVSAVEQNYKLIFWSVDPFVSKILFYKS